MAVINLSVCSFTQVNGIQFIGVTKCATLNAHEKEFSHRGMII